MNVVISHAGKVNKWVRQALEPYNPALLYAPPNEPTAYVEHMIGLWEFRESFILNEADKLPWPGALEELWACPMIWCAYSYPRYVAPNRHGVGDYYGFGCVKFTTELIDKVPNVWTDMENRHYRNIDTHFEYYTYCNNLRVHHHRPAILHLHEEL